jgi:hypothetical protein
MRKPNLINQSQQTGLTLIEMVISMALIVIVFGALLPQFRVMFRSLDLRQASAETLQNSRVFSNDIEQLLAQAVSITAVSASSNNSGYIEFVGSDGNAYRCDCSSNYIRFGLTGQQQIMAGPVSSLKFTCYAYSDLNTPTTTPSSIDYIKVDTTFTDSTGHNLNETVSANVLMPRDSVSGSAVLVNYFDGYSNGQVNARTSTWKGNTSLNNAVIEADPAAASNKTIRIVQANGSQSAAYCVLSSSATVAENTTRTLYMKFRRANVYLDQMFGLTDVDTPALDGVSWEEFRAQWGIVDNEIRVRDGVNIQTLAYSSTGTQVVISGNTWYYLWVVIDNTNDTIKLYLNHTGAAATASDLLVNKDLLTQSTFGFRYSTTNDLDRFYWRVQYGDGTNNQKIWIDDIYIMEGTELAVPLWDGTLE